MTAISTYLNAQEIHRCIKTAKQKAQNGDMEKATKWLFEGWSTYRDNSHLFQNNDSEHKITGYSSRFFRNEIGECEVAPLRIHMYMGFLFVLAGRIEQASIFFSLGAEEASKPRYHAIRPLQDFHSSQFLEHKRLLQEDPESIKNVSTIFIASEVIDMLDP